MGVLGKAAWKGQVSEEHALLGLRQHSVAGALRGASCLNLSGHQSSRPLLETQIPSLQLR